DEVGGELRRLAAADVPDRVDSLGRDEEDLAGIDGRRRPPLHLVLQRPFEDIDDLFARMHVPDRRHVRADHHAVLDDLASRHAEIVLLEIGPLESRGLRSHHVPPQLSVLSSSTLYEGSPVAGSSRNGALLRAFPKLKRSASEPARSSNDWSPRRPSFQ